MLTLGEATLGSGNLQAAVKLPDSEEKDEWLAVHTVDFYNQINLLYGSITDWCTKQTCPIMSAGSKFEYHWADGVKVKTPIALRCASAPFLLFTADTPAARPSTWRR